MRNLTISLPQSHAEAHDAALAVLEHLAVNPPEEQTAEYNLGLELLFNVARQSAK